MNRSFETLQVGDSWQTHGRTLTEADLSMSCMTSGDWHPIHADEHHAKATPAGRRLFQGTYGLHLAMGMTTQCPAMGAEVIGNLGFKDWRFLAPLTVGDTVHVEVRIESKRLTSDGKRGLIERHIKLVNHDGVVVQQGLTTLMVAVETAA